MVRVRDTLISLPCSVCNRKFTVPFKQYRAEVDFHKPTKAEPFQGTKFQWVCSNECREVQRADWGCPGFYNRKGNIAKARAAKAAGKAPVKAQDESN